jgi:hypothetical protein
MSEVYEVLPEALLFLALTNVVSSQIRGISCFSLARGAGSS